MASELIPNITREQVNKGLDIVIVSSSNNSNFKKGNPLYLRASNGAKPQEKVFNEMAESEALPYNWNADENGDVFAIIEKVSKFQVSTYNREQKQYDIYINDVYLTAAEQKAFLDEQGFTEDEFLNRYGKKGMFSGYLIKFKL